MQANRAGIFIESLESTDYLESLRAGLEYIDFRTLTGSSATVFLKPNLTFPSYRPGVMTNPAAVEAAIVALKDYPVRVVLGDSDSGGYNRFSMDEVYSRTGIDSFAEKYGVSVVNLSLLESRSTVQIQTRTGTIPVELPSLLTDEIDLLITMPVPKVHMNTGVSLTFKNQWGCIPEPNDRLRLHPNFSDVVIGVNQAIHSRVAIVDGMWGLTRSGPLEGDAVPLGWVLVSDSIGAAAKACCKLMGIPVGRITHLSRADEMGLIPGWSDIRLNQPLEPFVASEPFYLRRKWTDYPGLFAFRSSALAHLAYFSPFASILHRILYLFREPFYEYDRRS